MKYMVTLEVDTKGSGLDPADWFWTDACPNPDDDVTVVEIAEVEGE